MHPFFERTKDDLLMFLGHFDLLMFLSTLHNCLKTAVYQKVSNVSPVNLNYILIQSDIYYVRFSSQILCNCMESYLIKLELLYALQLSGFIFVPVAFIMVIHHFGRRFKGRL